MYKALYNFKATHTTALSFGEGEVFVELPGAKNDKNWYFVASSLGQVGYVPRNYVRDIAGQMTDADGHSHLGSLTDTVRASAGLTSKERREVMYERYRILIQNDFLKSKSYFERETVAELVSDRIMFRPNFSAE